jgi:hypothetical protein
MTRAKASCIEDFVHRLADDYIVKTALVEVLAKCR